MPGGKKWEMEGDAEQAGMELLFGQKLLGPLEPLQCIIDRGTALTGCFSARDLELLCEVLLLELPSKYNWSNQNGPRQHVSPGMPFTRSDVRRI